ncbi:MAG: outer membrane protein assembly factor BamE [Xanthomonadales bacterium]|nr:outer membrane protein assembly factor BamE [Xanthomonadales bacterium]
MPQRFRLTRPAVLVIALLSLGLSGCGLFYKQPVQQGNVLEQDDIDLLKPGMSKRQVSLIIGTPAIVSPFHHDRWEYVSRFKNSDDEVERKNFTVFFENGVLTRLEGDYQPGGTNTDNNREQSERAIAPMSPDKDS